jgi:hypothetical protein
MLDAVRTGCPVNVLVVLDPRCSESDPRTMLVFSPSERIGLLGTPCAPAKAGAQYWVPAFARIHDW